MTAVATEEIAISLELGHDSPCFDFSGPLYEQMADGDYGLCSVMPLPVSLEDWRESHRTARKRADRAQSLGYRFVRVNRHERVDELYAINTSAPERQGRPMSSGYLKRPSDTPDPDYPCERHGVHPYGVETADGVLVSYLWIYRAGQLALVSQILGHADHLENDIMFFLFQGMLACEPPDDGLLVYNRADSGTEGLRFFKARLGFKATPVRWAA